MMSDDLLSELATTGFGPVVLVKRDSGEYIGSALGHEILVTLDGLAYRCRTMVDVPWPRLESAPDGHLPITAALHELAYFHPTDIVDIEITPGSPVTIRLWVAAADATAGSVARAVRATAHIAELAHRTVSDLSALLESEAEEEAEQAWYEADRAQSEAAPEAAKEEADTEAVEEGAQAVSDEERVLAPSPSDAPPAVPDSDPSVPPPPPPPVP